MTPVTPGTNVTHPHTDSVEKDLIQIGRTSVWGLGRPVYIDMMSLYIRDTVTLVFKIEREVNIGTDTLYPVG